MIDAPPSTAESGLRTLVAATWSEVLGHDAFGLDDSFLMVGGDSLRAAQMASRLSTALGTEVPLLLVLEMETIRRLAEALETGG